ncbi:DUF4265 domain-containing protein [Actinoplanes palleronii]|uniref:DUF3592 domain-containing protein n=1 Tax=Actinoplanes palleronii TaxID=113570 RepID=A0ABQ4BQ42_9ACTN|nr:DUF4265 domain-containing protein [Actinoplanes palleronii]GIE72796.1 hypothetical protein Apa02nite_089040 [Actinoplanes palleronii]
MPRPLRILTLLLGLVLITAAALDLITLQQRADRIRATGVPVSAGVLHPSTRNHHELTVEYSLGAHTYRTDLTEIGWSSPSAGRGERLTLTVDPDHPSDATAPGLVSAPWWRGGYLGVGTLGLTVLVATLWGWLRTPHGDPMIVVPGPLTHPAPAWADRADSTVLGLILFPNDAQPPRDEVLPARRRTAQTSEICCVPFQQTRLSLGDVVQVDPNGYAGAVITPSGRTTFALLTARSADAPDVHALARDFPGTVVEDLGPGRYAVAAPEDQAHQLHTTIQRWEQEARASYRSPLSPNPDTTPLT